MILMEAVRCLRFSSSDNRSLAVDNPFGGDRATRRVNYRENFRPFAHSVLGEDVAELDGDSPLHAAGRRRVRNGAAPPLKTVAASRSSTASMTRFAV
jgi:hypothetical protein